MSYFWGARFNEKLDEDTIDFTTSEDIILDQKLIMYDILGTQAHNLMLYKIGLLKEYEIKEILKVLEQLKKEYYKGNIKLKKEFEDVHLNIEKTITKKIGEEIGGKIHLARSRNDQILVDLRMFMRDNILEIMIKNLDLIKALMEISKENYETIIPGYTHMQHAQPITLSHWCLSHIDSIIRDLERLEEIYKRINTNPLGAGAISGSKWPIKRDMTSDLLGFEKIQENTLDVVSSRGELEAELISILCLIMIHISKLAEDLILWSSFEFNFIELNDKFTTGSSIMPQKKNPDICELARGKTALLIGNLTSILNIIKSLPSGYNRDLQETKKPLFNSMETTIKTITVFSKLLAGIEFNKKRMEEITKSNFSNAVDLSDLLIEKGIPFRTAYKIIGNLVKNLKKQSKTFEGLSSSDLIGFVKKEAEKEISLSDDEIKNAIDPKKTILKKNHIGGPAPIENKRMMEQRMDIVKIFENKIKEKQENLKMKFNNFQKEINKIIQSP
jgi:argininosuccinate lyase